MQYYQWEGDRTTAVRDSRQTSNPQTASDTIDCHSPVGSPYVSRVIPVQFHLDEVNLPHLQAVLTREPPSNGKPEGAMVFPEETHEPTESDQEDGNDDSSTENEDVLTISDSDESDSEDEWEDEELEETPTPDPDDRPYAPYKSYTELAMHIWSEIACISKRGTIIYFLLL